MKLAVTPPAGVQATLAETTVKPSDKGEVSLTVVVSDKATIGDQMIQITGTPDSGTPTTLDVKIKVAARADLTKLTLSGPFLATTIKQGETQTIAVTLKHRTKTTGDAALKVENAPKGVKAELTSPTVKSTDSGDFGLKVTADKAAPLGEYTIRITGTAENATIEPLM